MLRAAWSNLTEGFVAPWQLARLSLTRQTWRTIAGAAEMLAMQCHGGITIATPIDGQDSGPDAALAMRSLIQLDGDLVLFVDPTWLESQRTQAPDRLLQALAAHGAQIDAALQPLRQGFDTAGRLVLLAGRSRWTVLGTAGLSQGAALAWAPEISISGLLVWIGDPWAYLGMLLCQMLSLVLLALVGVIRFVVRWWIRRRVGARLSALTARLSGEEIRAARATV